jgi:hypothetical protein
MTIEQVEVPAKLSADLIRRVKSYVTLKMHTFDSVMGTIGPDPVQAAYVDLKWVNTTSGFVHPAGTVGPAELALLKVRGVHGFRGTIATAREAHMRQRRGKHVWSSPLSNSRGTVDMPECASYCCLYIKHTGP